MRTYMLSKIASHSETGYSILQEIIEKTNGAWRPGPGTIYPLLRSLAKEGLAKGTVSDPRRERGSISYSITEKGKLELREMRRIIAARAAQGSGMMAIFAELLPASDLARLLLIHFRSENEVMASKFSDLPAPERDAALKELKGILKSQLANVERELRKKKSKRN